MKLKASITLAKQGSMLACVAGRGGILALLPEIGVPAGKLRRGIASARY